MHNINQNNNTGNYAFYSVKEPAWHGLGHIAGEYESSLQVLKHAGLDYTVEKRPLFTYDNQNMYGNPDFDLLVPEVELPNHYATVRTDTQQPLGVVGRDYKVLQNEDVFSFFDAIAGKDGVYYETAGALGNGERVFVTAKLPSYIRIGNSDDVIANYLFITNTHDGTRSITAALTPIRIVCNNTLNIALRNCTNMVKIRHTENAKERLQEAHRVMGMVNTLTPQLNEVYNSFARVRITDAQLRDLIERAMAPSAEVLAHVLNGEREKLSTQFENTCTDVFNYAMRSETQQLETTKGTLFGALQAVTGYFQNVRDYKTADQKINNLFYGGTAQQRSQSAFNLCVDFITNN